MPLRKVLIEDGIWAGHDCFIVGGGPSLKRLEDFGMLRNTRTIAINRAHEFFEPSIVFAMDRRFWNRIYGKGDGLSMPDEACARLRGDAVCKLWAKTGGEGLSGEGSEDVQIVQNIGGKHGKLSESLHEGLACAGNSGYGALNLALLLGARRIFLLGFDMKLGDKGDSHFHGGYASHPLKAETLKRFADHFRKAAPLIAERYPDTEIVLVGDSELDCFQRSALENFDWLSKFGSKNPIVVSFYTDAYKDYAREMEKSARLHGFRVHCEYFPQDALGDWNNTLYHKPIFIKKMLNKFKESVLWVDADCVFRRGTDRFSDDGLDICVPRIDWKKLGKDRDNELLSAVVYVNYTPNGLSIIDRWIGACNDSVYNWKLRGGRRPLDQELLAKVLQSLCWGERVGEIPMDHAQIFDLMAAVSDNPVVECLQGSRELKARVNEEARRAERV